MFRWPLSAAPCMGWPSFYSSSTHVRYCTYLIAPVTNFVSGIRLNIKLINQSHYNFLIPTLCSKVYWLWSILKYVMLQVIYTNYMLYNITYQVQSITMDVRILGCVIVRIIAIASDYCPAITIIRLTAYWVECHTYFSKTQHWFNIHTQYTYSYVHCKYVKVHSLILEWHHFMVILMLMLVWIL